MSSRSRVPPGFVAFAMNQMDLQHHNWIGRNLTTTEVIELMCKMFDWHEEWESLPKETAFDWIWPFKHDPWAGPKWEFSDERSNMIAADALRESFLSIKGIYAHVAVTSVNRFLMAQLINTARELVMQARVLGAEEE